MSAARLRLSVACLLLALTAPGAAAEFVTIGDHQIHYNAVRADFIPASVARAHGLTRSGTRALVNITVLRRADDGTTTPMAASITLQVRNLLGQTQNVTMRAIREPRALYYIGEFRISGVDTYRFEAVVEPEGGRGPHTLRWSQELFAD